MITSTATLEAWTAAGLEEIYPVAYTDFYESGRPTAWRAGAAARAWVGEPRSLSILEVGAGAGRITKHLARSWSEAGAIEPNPDFARLLGQAAPTVTVWPTLEDCIAETGEHAFDVVMSFLVLQHYPSRDRYELLAQMFTLARRLVLVQIPLYETSREPATYTDVGTWRRDQLRAAGASHGFVIREAREIPGGYDPEWKLAEVPPEHFYLHVLERWKGETDGQDSLASRRPAA